MPLLSHATDYTSIERAPNDILFLICDELEPCSVACLSLTSPVLYLACKSYHPKPFDLDCKAEIECGELCRCRPNIRPSGYEARWVLGMMSNEDQFSHTHDLARMIKDWKGLKGYKAFHFHTRERFKGCFNQYGKYLPRDNYFFPDYCFNKFLRLSAYGDDDEENADHLSIEKCWKLEMRYAAHQADRVAFQSPHNLGDAWERTPTPFMLNMTKREIRDLVEHIQGYLFGRPPWEMFDMALAWHSDTEKVFEDGINLLGL